MTAHARSFRKRSRSGRQEFQESLAASEQELDESQESFLGISLREFVHEWKYQALVLFKCCLLQPKVRLRLVTYFGTAEFIRCSSSARDAKGCA